MIHIVTKWLMSDLQMSKIKVLKIFKASVSMATKLSNRQRFNKTTVISKQIICILLLHREI